MELYQLIYLDIPDHKQWNFQKETDTIFFEIEIPATKTDTIISETKITYVSNLAHAWAIFTLARNGVRSLDLRIMSSTLCLCAAGQ
jgi:hypothetical protein